MVGRDSSNLLYRFLVLGTDLFNPPALWEVLSEVVLYGQNVIASSSDVRFNHRCFRVWSLATWNFLGQVALSRKPPASAPCQSTLLTRRSTLFSGSPSSPPPWSVCYSCYIRRCSWRLSSDPMLSHVFRLLLWFLER